MVTGNGTFLLDTAVSPAALTLTPVPEPAGLAAAGGMVAALAGVRRRLSTAAGSEVRTT